MEPGTRLFIGRIRLGQRAPGNDQAMTGSCCSTRCPAPASGEKPQNKPTQPRPKTQSTLGKVVDLSTKTPNFARLRLSGREVSGKKWRAATELGLACVGTWVTSPLGFELGDVMKKILTLSTVALSTLALISAASLASAEGPAKSRQAKTHAQDGRPGRAHRGPGGAKFFEKLDANKDGKLSQAEFGAQGSQMFTNADANKDGVVTVAEFEAVRKLRASQHMGEKFKRLDKNADGKVTKEEAGKMPERFFKRLDQNGDGVVTQEEATAGMRKRMDSRPGKEAAQHGMFVKLDANKDGQVTRQEAEAARAQHFAKLDTNKDGLLTREEMKAHRADHRGMKHGKRGNRAK